MRSLGKRSRGGEALAKEVVQMIEDKESSFVPLYSVDESIENKICCIAKEIYRADDVNFSKKALNQIKEIVKLGLDKMPVCIAKTQYSFSEDPTLLGAPRGFELNVREVKASAGAGFIVALTGDIMTITRY